MSESISWRPLDGGFDLPKALKFWMNNYQDEDGVNPYERRPCNLDKDDIPAFRCAVENGVDGAQTVIDAIVEHGFIVIEGFW